MLYFLIYSTNIRTEYFKQAAYSLFFPLQNAVYFIMLPFLVPVLFTFYIQVCSNLKENSGAKMLTTALPQAPLKFRYHREMFRVATVFVEVQ